MSCVNAITLVVVEFLGGDDTILYPPDLADYNQKQNQRKVKEKIPLANFEALIMMIISFKEKRSRLD